MPSMPPTGLINDYITGYMGAAGATAALLKREKEGGSYHVTVSLTRNAMWYQSFGLIPSIDRSFASKYLQRVWYLKPEMAHAFLGDLAITPLLRQRDMVLEHPKSWKSE